MSAPAIKMIARNRKAGFNFELLDRYESGLELTGSEVKSLRDGQANIAEAYVKLEKGEAWLLSATIPAYKQASYNNHEPTRRRKLLLSRAELRKLQKSTQEKGLTIVPVSLYFKGPWAKLEIALGRGKKVHDKRQDLKEKADRREARQGSRRY